MSPSSRRESAPRKEDSRSEMSGNGKESVVSKSDRLEMASETAEQFEVRLAPRPQAAGEARAAVSRFVADFSADAAFRAQLAVSELVANCVRHVRFSDGERITIRVRRIGPTLRVKVEDPGDGVRTQSLQPPGLDSTSGRGLRMVEAVVDRWDGVSDERGRVQFEIDDRR
jgi:anti-sigma regulatory factor (Ser/Thr protein kinase)